MNANLRAQVEKFAEDSREAILRDIERLVAINSVEGEARPGAPYGEGPAAALKLGLEIARELGLETVGCQGRIGYAQVGGDSDRYLATITHLDVVPAGPGRAGLRRRRRAPGRSCGERTATRGNGAGGKEGSDGDNGVACKGFWQKSTKNDCKK